MTVYEKLKQEQDSLLEKEGSMKMDQNLTVTRSRKRSGRKEKNSSRKKMRGFLKNLRRQASFTH